MMKNKCLAIFVAVSAVVLAAENDAAPVRKVTAPPAPAASVPSRVRQPAESPRMQEAVRNLRAAQQSGNQRSMQEANAHIWAVHNEESAHEQQAQNK